ncbi:MAG: hypothetical protein IJX24_01045 [Oscillospiraceae bacterium]|nr:hypothetical protein [Oscillospiraceae bacterium]
MFWKPGFLTSMTVLMAEHIDTIQYQLDNGEWEDAVITNSGTTGTDEYHVYKYYNIAITTASGGTITGLRVLDNSGNTIAQKNENIIKQSGTDLYIKFKYRLYEEGYN